MRTINAIVARINNKLRIRCQIFNDNILFLLPPLGILDQISCVAGMFDIADHRISGICHVLICPNNGKWSGHIFKRRIKKNYQNHRSDQQDAQLGDMQVEATGKYHYIAASDT